MRHVNGWHICCVIVCIFFPWPYLSTVLVRNRVDRCRKRTCRKQVVQAVYQGGGRHVIIDGDILGWNELQANRQYNITKDTYEAITQLWADAYDKIENPHMNKEDDT